MSMPIIAALSRSTRPRSWASIFRSVSKDEASAARPLQDPSGKLAELLGRTDAADDELAARAAARGRQRRRYLGEEVQPRQLGQLGLQVLLQHLVGRAAALAPGLEDEAGDRGHAAARAHAAVDQEHVADLGDLVDIAVDLGGVAFDVVERGRRVGKRDAEHEALVLHRRRLLGRDHVQAHARGEHQRAEHGDHALRIQRAVQPAVVGGVQALEALVQPRLQPALALAVVAALEQARAHHRRQRQRDHAR